MRKELSPLAIGGIALAVALILGFFGFMYFQRATGVVQEDPELLRKQAEVERGQFKSKLPNTPPDPGAAEREARAKHKGG